MDNTVQGVEHEAETCLVEEQLHAHGRLGVLQFECVPLGDGDDHAVAVNIGNGPREAIIADSGSLLEVSRGCFGLEKDHWLAVLEVVVNFFVALARHLDAVLVDRVVVGAPDAQWIPGVAARHFAGQADALGVQAISLLLLLVFQAEQFPLQLQLRYGRRVVHCL